MRNYSNEDHHHQRCSIPWGFSSHSKCAFRSILGDILLLFFIIFYYCLIFDLAAFVISFHFFLSLHIVFRSVTFIGFTSSYISSHHFFLGVPQQEVQLVILLICRSSHDMSCPFQVKCFNVSNYIFFLQFFYFTVSFRPSFVIFGLRNILMIFR